MTVTGPARRPAGVLARLARPGLGHAGRGPPPPSARLLLRGRGPGSSGRFSPAPSLSLPRVPFAGVAPTIRLLMTRYLWTAPPTPGGSQLPPGDMTSDFLAFLCSTPRPRAESLHTALARRPGPPAPCGRPRGRALAGGAARRCGEGAALPASASGWPCASGGGAGLAWAAAPPADPRGSPRPRPLIRTGTRRAAAAHPALSATPHPRKAELRPQDACTPFVGAQVLLTS